MSRTNSERFADALTWALLALLAYLVYLVVSPFLVPLAWASVLAVVTYPVFERLSLRWGAGRAAAFTTLATAVIVIAPAVALTTAFAREALDLASNVQQAFADGRFSSIQRALSDLARRAPAAWRIDVGSLTTDALKNGAAYLVSQSGSILGNVAGFLFDLVLALFATFFLLRDSVPLMRAVRRLIPMEDAETEELIARTGDLISAGVTSAMIVAGLQGLLGGIAFAAVDISAPVFWGVVMAFFCLVPLGAWIIWLPAAVFLALDGQMTRALILTVVGAGIISMVDNVVRPLLLSGRAHMNGLVIFVSLLGGLSVFGLLGLVLGPILVVTALSLLTTYVGDLTPRR